MKKRKTKKETVASMAQKAGIPKGTVYARLRNGWTLKKALNTPVQVQHRSKTKKVEVTKEEVKVTTHQRTAPKANKMVVEKYKSDRPSKLVWWGLGTIVVLLITIIIGR